MRGVLSPVPQQCSGYIGECWPGGRMPTCSESEEIDPISAQVVGSSIAPRSRRSSSTSELPSIPEAGDDRAYPEPHHHYNQRDPPSHTSECGGDTRDPSDGNSDSDHRRTLSR